MREKLHKGELASIKEEVALASRVRISNNSNPPSGKNVDP
jgi:hypothetical protein